MNEAAIKFLIDNGASRWTKGDLDRLYLNNAIFAVIGLECTYYKTGNISSSTLKGERISHSYARDLLSAANRSYINMKTGKFFAISGRFASNVSDMVNEWLDNNNQ